MKTIKSFDYRELNIYLWDGEKLSIRVRDFLTQERARVISSYHTESRRGYDSPTAVFVEEDPLNDGRGCQPCSWFFNDWPMDFILVPVTFNGNDYDVWIPLRKFNASLSQQEREELAIRNPKYFSDKPEKRLGFFTEDNNINEEYQEIHVNSGQSWKIKTRGENCYKVKVLLPTRNNRFNTFRWSVVHQTPGGLGAGYQEACFLTQHEAEEFIQRHNLDEQYPSRYGEWYAYPARVDLNLIKVPLEDGEEIHIRTECLPRTTTWGGEDDPAGIEWWDKVRRLFPRYFSTEPERRLGFFNEGIDTNFDAEEIIRIMTDTSLSSSEKCKRLFGRNEDYLIHVQWLCFRKSDKWIEYLYEHNYLSDDAKERYGNNYPQFRSDFAEVIDRGENDRNDSGKRTLFYDWRQGEEVPCDLDTSFSAYVVDGECNGSTVERRVRNWYNHIKFSVSYMEDRGYVIDRSGIKRLGFFNK